MVLGPMIPKDQAEILVRYDQRLEGIHKFVRRFARSTALVTKGNARAEDGRHSLDRDRLDSHHWWRGNLDHGQQHAV